MLRFQIDLFERNYAYLIFGSLRGRCIDLICKVERLSGRVSEYCRVLVNNTSALGAEGGNLQAQYSVPDKS